MLTESWVLLLFIPVIANCMDDAATGKFSFGDNDITLKYASWKTPISTIIFEANIFVICKDY